MGGLLTYSVAGHRFGIQTPDKTVTRGILSSYASFTVENSTDSGHLFYFQGNRQVDIPDVPCDDVVQRDTVTYSLYHTVQGITASMQQNGREHRLFASPGYQEIISDVTLLSGNEAPFINSFLRLAYGVRAVHRQTIKVHASVIELNGKALVFLGKSGAGKSTHSRLWLQHIPGCTLLNDDEPILRIFEDGAVRVYGAPWSGSTPCYRNDWAEVAAIVHLHQSPDNKLSRMTPLEGLSSLFKSTALLRSDRENKDKVLDVVTGVVERIPVYRLACRPDHEAVLLSRSLLPKE
ncbi:MAG TPA: hypothetical protein PLR34_09320 [Bacteroidales bacterium]|jgi:hypothetical protein|nr:hypothetical protein [Bacteroidales bacterium]HNR27757.1 hypothetical protein [Bacteroidales bacterium]HNZ47194.1 hypothetical protein [Bacteroidales bacterium]HOG33467.1 hypothetical protein [Bacteroidales bacterium]HOQ97173.1 hypothetical protein [Bacteroidales bacterium]